MTFTKAKVQKLRADLDAVLANAGMNDVEFYLGDCRFYQTEATFKLVAKVKGAVSREEDALAMYAKMDKVDANGVGPKGEKLVEYHTRKPKYPYIYVTKGGKRFKCTARQAQNLFGAV